MRTAALEALSQHPTDERARRALLGGLQDADSTVRSTALGLLGSLMTQWPGAEEGAILALSDRAPAVRQLALLTLWEASSPRVPDALSIVLRDPDPGIRAQAEEFMHAAEAAAGATTE